jgi:hypothetical protein
MGEQRKKRCRLGIYFSERSGAWIHNKLGRNLPRFSRKLNAYAKLTLEIRIPARVIETLPSSLWNCIEPFCEALTEGKWELKESRLLKPRFEVIESVRVGKGELNYYFTVR